MMILTKTLWMGLLLALGTALGCARAFAAAKPETPKPNVLFIAIDDMNDWTTLFDKSNPIKTPNLERLAARGMFFSRGIGVRADGGAVRFSRLKVHELGSIWSTDGPASDQPEPRNQPDRKVAPQ